MTAMKEASISCRHVGILTAMNGESISHGACRHNWTNTLGFIGSLFELQWERVQIETPLLAAVKVSMLPPSNIIKFL